MKSFPHTGLGLLTLSLLLGAVSSCGGGGSSGGSAGPASADFLIQDAAVDDLSSFTATVSELRLLDPMGMPSANLLPGSVDIEFLGLQQTSAWLASLQPPMGTWRSVRVNFVPGSTVARAGDGSVVAVNEAGTVLNADFASDLVVGATGYQLVQIDLDLASSLSGDVAAPPIVFTPSGFVLSSTGSSSASIDEIKGTVQSFSPGGSTLTIDAFVDDDQNVALGAVNVQVSGSTLLLMENGAAFPSSAAFFAALANGQTFLEVHGNLLAGNIVATRIEIEDQTGGVNSANSVEIEGRIVGLNSGAMTLTLLIQEIEKGQAIAGPVLSGLGNPGTVQVSWDGMTRFLDDDTNQMLTSAALAVGLEIDAKFPMFMSQPFAASEIEIEDLNVEYEGFIQDVSGLPNSMIVRLKNSDPAVLSGLVASSSTNVVVDMTGTAIRLDVDSEPTLSVNDLQPGLRLDLYGLLGGRRWRRPSMRRMSKSNPANSKETS